MAPRSNFSEKVYSYLFLFTLFLFLFILCFFVCFFAKKTFAVHEFYNILQKPQKFLPQTLSTANTFLIRDLKNCSNILMFYNSLLGNELKNLFDLDNLSNCKIFL